MKKPPALCRGFFFVRTGRALQALSHLSRDDRLDAATDVEVADHFHPAWLARGCQVSENPIHRTLVENTVVAKAPEIQLETLQLEASRLWHVRDPDGAEVGCSAVQFVELFSVALYATHGTERRELVAVHANLVVAFSMRVRERLQQFRPCHWLVRVTVQFAGVRRASVVSSKLTGRTLRRSKPPRERRGGTAPGDIPGGSLLPAYRSRS